MGRAGNCGQNGEVGRGMVDKEDVARRRRSGAVDGAGRPSRTIAGRAGTSEDTMRQTYFPSNDAALVAWGANFLAQIEQDWERLGLSQASVEAFAVAQGALAQAYREASIVVTRTQQAVVRKNSCRSEMKAQARRLVSILRGQDLTDAQLGSLGLTVHRERRRRSAAPDVWPSLHVLAVRGRTVTMQLMDSTVMKRRRPVGVRGATIFCRVESPLAADAAAAADGFVFCGNTQRTTVDVVFPDDVPPGAVVGLRACWYNNASVAGPMSDPIHTNLPGGNVAMGGRTECYLRAA